MTHANEAAEHRPPAKASESAKAGESAPSAELTYAQAGVDIAAGDQAAERIESHLRRTYGPRVLGRHGAFAGMVRLDYNEKLFQRNYRDPVLVSSTDSVGTKVMLAVQLGIDHTIGQDCVAMCVNDVIVQGAEPLFFLDYLGIHKTEPTRAERIVKGVADGCELADCALLGGEMCEMPEVYKAGDYDLAGFTVGVAELNKVIDGPSMVEKDDVILGLGSSGVHSNGFTLVRAIVRQAKLDLDQPCDDLEDPRPLGRVLLEPTCIYAKPINRLLRQYKVKQPVRAMAHITGGGLPGNLNRVLPNHLNARISKRSWPTPPLFGFLQKHGNVDEDEMFGVFNMGIGYTLIVRPHFAEAITDKLERFGQSVHRLGTLTGGTGRVELRR